MSKFHRLFEDTQGNRAYFRSATAEPLQEASIAKMNRKAKSAVKSKFKPSASQKPYNSLSAQEKKVVDKQVAADAKAFMDDYGKVERTADGPMLVIEADPIKEYEEAEGTTVEYEYTPSNARDTWDEPASVWNETARVTLEDFATGTFRIVLRPYLVGFDKVQYLFDEDESSYSPSDSFWTSKIGYWDDALLDGLMLDARTALEKGGLKAMERAIKSAIPSVREIEDAFIGGLESNNIQPSDY